MQFYVPFGDWSEDGHGKSKKYLVEAPSMESLLEAQKKATEAGFTFDEGFASDYEEPYLSENNIELLKSLGYDFSNYEYDEDEETYWFDVTDIRDMFFFILNKYGANVSLVNEDIPMICNWTCPGFETVGYGCFD